MPPRKVKLHSYTGRLKNIATSSSTGNNGVNTPNVSNQNNSNTQNSRNIVPSNETNRGTGDSQALEQFELELYWCIQTLENSLGSGKLNAKQAQDAAKTLKLLKGNNQPIVKKRQLMSATFGDYRKKMADEEKNLRAGSISIQFVEPITRKQSTTSKIKSHFLKKSFASTSGGAVTAMEKLSIDTSPEQNCNGINDSVNNSKKKNVETEFSSKNEFDDHEMAGKSSDVFINKSKFITTNNFKFNFLVEND